MQLNERILTELMEIAFQSTKIPPGMTFSIQEERAFWFKVGWQKAVASVLKLMEMAEGK